MRNCASMEKLREAVRQLNKMDEHKSALKTFLDNAVASRAGDVKLLELIKEFEEIKNTKLPLAEFTADKAVDFLKHQYGQQFVFKGDPMNPTIKTKNPNKRKPSTDIEDGSPPKKLPVAEVVAAQIQKPNAPSTSSTKESNAEAPMNGHSSATAAAHELDQALAMDLSNQEHNNVQFEQENRDAEYAAGIDYSEFAQYLIDSNFARQVPENAVGEAGHHPPDINTIRINNVPIRLGCSFLQNPGQDYAGAISAANASKMLHFKQLVAQGNAANACPNYAEMAAAHVAGINANPNFEEPDYVLMADAPNPPDEDNAQPEIELDVEGMAGPPPEFNLPDLIHRPDFLDDPNIDFDFPLPAENGVHWRVIRCYTINDDNNQRNIFADEVTSSSSAGQPSNAEADEADGPTQSIDVGNGNRAQNLEAIESNEVAAAEGAVSSSGIAMSEETSNRPHTSKYNLHGTSVSHARMDMYSMARHRQARSKRDIIKADVMKIIVSSPGGIFCRKLFKKYRRRYGKPLRFNNFDTGNPIRLIHELGLKVLITRPLGDTGDLLLTVAPPGALGPIDLSGLDPGNLFPRSCMQSGDVIPSLPREDCRPGDLLLATVGGITSPSDFTLVKYGPQNHYPLEAMSNEMLEFFREGGRALEIPRAALQVDLFCSVSYAGVWHRARILEIINTNHVRIRHVDYGTEDVVSANSIRPLLIQWAQLPMQAIKARMDSVVPPAHAGEHWPQESIEAFQFLVLNKALFVHVAAVDEEDWPMADVALIDTSTRTDRWIDIELIKAGLADEIRSGPHRLHRRVA